MSYRGSKVPIPLGKLGVNSDDAHESLPIGQLVRGVNIDVSQGLIQKAPGSRRWNNTTLGSSVLNAFDWHPVDGIQRVVAACADGQLYRFKNPYRSQQFSVTAGAPDALTISSQSHFVVGGQQSASMARKLFFFSGNDQVQVIDGDSTTRRNIAKPAREWVAGDYPTFGIVFRSRLYTLGTKGQPNLVLGSTVRDQEDFQDTESGDQVVTHTVFPGEGERLVSAWVFKGKLFVAKYPNGIYMLNDENDTPSLWFFQRVSSSFGAASAHSYAEGSEDGLVCNQSGSVTSLSASFQLGDVKTADLFGNLRIEQMIAQETNPEHSESRWALYYPTKKQFYFTYRSPSGTATDRMVCVDLSTQQPKPFLIAKDTPNSLFLMKNRQGRSVPSYGSADGFIYTLDDPNRLVGASGFAADFRIPATDLGSDNNKIFDFLEVEAEHTGKWDISCDVYMDDSFKETLVFKMSNDPALASTTTGCFQLDSSRLLGRQTRSVTRGLHGTGKAISFRFYTAANAQNFRITKLVVYARMGNEDQKE